MANSGEVITSFIGVSASWIGIVILSKCLKLKFITNLKESFKYSIFIRLSIEDYVDIFLGVMIQANSVSFGETG